MINGPLKGTVSGGCPVHPPLIILGRPVETINGPPFGHGERAMSVFATDDHPTQGMPAVMSGAHVNERDDLM